MKVSPRSLLTLLALPLCAQLQAQQLTVEKIMRDPKWIGTSPSNPFWSSDSKTLYFSWNPDKALSDSLYYISLTDRTPRKTVAAARSELQQTAEVTWNAAYTQYLYHQSGDLYLRDVKANKTTRITHTAAYESSEQFGFDDRRVVYRSGSDLYSWDIRSGATEQLTRFIPGNKPEAAKETGSAAEKWLKAQQLELIDVLASRKEKKAAAEAFSKSLVKEKGLRELYLEGKSAGVTRISDNGQYVAYALVKYGTSSSTDVPNYVTENGYTKDISARPKVGTEGQATSALYLYDRQRDTVYAIDMNAIPGLTDKAAYQQQDTAKKAVKRDFRISGLHWSPDSKYALVDIRSNDAKDRWLMLLDAATAQLSVADRQRNEAWVNYSLLNDLGWLNEHTIWFQSEATGYAHLYTYDVRGKNKRQLTSGNYEVQQASLSNNKKYFYLHTNETHPGVVKFYRLPVSGGKAEVLTTLEGGTEAVLSPDEKWITFRYSAANQPWELYLQENKPGAKAVQVTNMAQSPEFKTYPWRTPEVLTFAARDGANVYARIYTPEASKKNGAAVVFVHGAGYLQNAHKWWSSYFREYMFHNLLTDMGFTVLDMDYRGSAGYGADWRTGIYRHMGGKDLTDHVDGAHFLAKNYGIDPKRIGIYGGSYGGFITLMAMFTTPDEFKAGAALRSVTDWAHYNHGYTNAILNTPVEDSIAFAQSSPIYFAEGLKGHLLMCHGVVDTNVHFQDIIRLSQRLIELGKDNWELAVYPVEDHGFVEPSSWTDEYKRILKLFTANLLSE